MKLHKNEFHYLFSTIFNLLSEGDYKCRTCKWRRYKSVYNFGGETYPKATTLAETMFSIKRFVKKCIRGKETNIIIRIQWTGMDILK